MKEEKKLHIVSFNVPYPPDYGGIIDVYYKLESLYKAGVSVILHCFTYERPEAEALESVCEKVYYYKRKSGLKYLLGRKPYIVSTRNSKLLEERLYKDSAPVLFEGLHSTLLLATGADISGKKIVRTHNIEHSYYKLLAGSERNILKKVFLSTEARKLEKYEAVLKAADQIVAISTTDNSHFRRLYGNSMFIPAFHQHSEVNTLEGKGDYLLFHGNLSVPENEKAVLYLIHKVISRIDYKVIIAGKNPSHAIRKTCDKHSHIELISNPEGKQMDELIRNAHINLLYTYQPTGLKLKLLHSLFGGRYCLVNSLMLSGSDLDKLCSIFTCPDDAIRQIGQLMKMEFTKEELAKRKEALLPYGNSVNANKLIKLIWES